MVRLLTKILLFAAVQHGLLGVPSVSVDVEDVDDEVSLVRFSFETQSAFRRGSFLLELHRRWAPASHDRFVSLLDAGFFPRQRLYRAIPGFVLDWNYAPPAGLANTLDPVVQFYNELPWLRPNESDRAAGGVFHSNVLGTIALGQEDDGSTRSEVFVNLADNSGKLDARGFWPFGRVVAKPPDVRGFWPFRVAKLPEKDGNSVESQVRRWQRGQMNFDYGDIFFAGNASAGEAARRQRAVMEGGSKYIDKKYPGCTKLVDVKRIRKYDIDAGKAHGGETHANSIVV